MMMMMMVAGDETRAPLGRERYPRPEFFGALRPTIVNAVGITTAFSVHYPLKQQSGAAPAPDRC